MASLFLLELTTVVSFLYSIFLMYSSFTSVEKMVLAFAWTIAVSLITALISRKSGFFNILILLILAPLYYFNSKSARLLTGTVLIFTFIYIKTSLGKVNYYEYVRKLKITYLIIIVATVFRLVFEDMTGSVGYALPFIIIYVLTSILLTRTMRHMDSNLDITALRGSNIRYALITAMGFAIALYEKVGASIVKILDKVIDLIYYPLHLLMRNTSLERNWERQVDEEIILEALEDSVALLAPEDPSNLALAQKVGTIINTLGKIIVGISFVLILFAIYEFLIRKERSPHEAREYREEREYIRKNKKKRRIFKERLPKEFNEQIRYYYRRFLNKLKKDKMEVLHGDTSLDINNRAEGVYNENIIKMREIYIETRYGGKDADENKVKEMERLYKEL